MTIKELKQIIKDLPENMKIGSSGHFGEFLECYNITIRNVYKDMHDYSNKELILCINLEDAGEEPN